MKKTVLTIVAVVLSLSQGLVPSALAQSSSAPSAVTRSSAWPDQSGKPANTHPLKSTKNPCAAFGAVFVPVAGSETCVRIGGGVGTDMGGSIAR